MDTKEKKFILSSLGKDILDHERAVLANAAHRSLVLELIQVYELSLKHISDQTQIDFHCLSSLAVGTLDALTLSDYMKLLCFYCFMQTQRCFPDAKARAFLFGLHPADRPLSINAKDKSLKYIQVKRNDRYYINDTVYLTQREYEVAKLLLKPTLTYKDMGKQLNLSTRTVEYYVANLRTKLKVSSRFEIKQCLKNIFNDIGG